jgi:hypothetical protein
MPSHDPPRSLTEREAPRSAPRPAELIAIRTLGIDLATAEVIEALRGEGIRSILLKGPVMARWLYDDEGERSYVDCDLLVAPADMTEAERVLASLGFAREGIESVSHDWPKHAIALRRRRDRVAIDLHRTFVGAAVSDRDLWEVLSSHTEEITVAGVAVEVLRPEGRALTLALHAAKDGGREEKVRRDLARGVGMPESLWIEAAELARELDALPAFAWGLRRIPQGADLAERLQLPTEMPAVLAIRYAEGAPPLAAGIDWFLRSESRRGALAVIRNKLFPSPAFMRAWSPVARRGRIGLMVAYAWRPVWVAGRAIPATWAVLGARLQAHRDTGHSGTATGHSGREA